MAKGNGNGRWDVVQNLLVVCLVLVLWPTYGRAPYVGLSNVRECAIRQPPLRYVIAALGKKQ